MGITVTVSRHLDRLSSLILGDFFKVDIEGLSGKKQDALLQQQQSTQ